MENKYAITLLAVFLTLTACSDDPAPAGNGKSTPIEIIIPHKPAWQPATRTELIGGGNSLSTRWVEGDKLYLAFYFFDEDYNNWQASGTATYTGNRWKTDISWPVNAIRGNVQITYVDTQSPGGDNFTNVDVLRSEAVNANTQEPFEITNISHTGTRMHFPDLAPGTTVYLQGDFSWYRFTERYILNLPGLTMGEVMPVQLDANRNIHVFVNYNDTRISFNGTDYQKIDVGGRSNNKQNQTYTIRTGSGTAFPGTNPIINP